MSRLFSASIAILLLLSPALTLAAPAHKQHAPHWHGYGFLPGYHQPPNDTVPVFSAKASSRRTPDYTPQYYYFGRPGFYRGRYNGGSFGPCWTYTPIGLIWNCG